MKKWLFRLIWIPALVLAVLFLVANRQPVAVSLDPFSATAPAVTTAALPLWLWLMAMMFVGFGAGVMGMWLSARPKRQKASAEHKELKSLKKELAAANAQLTAHEARDHDRAMQQAEPQLLTAETVDQPATGSG